jgi:hypothetical protein
LAILLQLFPSPIPLKIQSPVSNTGASAGGCGVLFAGFLKREVGLDGIFAGITGIFLLAGTVLLIGYRCFIRTDIERARLAR